jgi:DNA-binding response OmpR family regulator
VQIRILAVEDDPDIARLLSLELGRLGYSLRTVGTAAQAVEELKSGPPNLMLLDLGLPDRDGARAPARAARGRRRVAGHLPHGARQAGRARRRACARAPTITS